MRRNLLPSRPHETIGKMSPKEVNSSQLKSDTHTHLKEVDNQLRQIEDKIPKDKKTVDYLKIQAGIKTFIKDVTFGITGEYINR